MEFNEEVTQYVFNKIIRARNGEDIKFSEDEKKWMKIYSDYYGL